MGQLESEQVHQKLQTEQKTGFAESVLPTLRQTAKQRTSAASVVTTYYLTRPVSHRNQTRREILTRYLYLEMRVGNTK